MTKKKPEIKELLKFSEIDGLKIKKLISKNISDNLKKKYGKILFPFLGIVLHDEKKILFLLHKSPGDAEDEKVVVVHSADVTEENLKEFIDIIEKTKR